jgi:predicted TIM-barrel fold metal-dependent hydrolase
METPWGDLRVIDAHSHFFSHQFFQAFARLAARTLPADDPLGAMAQRLGVEIPPADVVSLARRWVDEMDRHGIDRMVLFTSVPGDHPSVAAAVKAFPTRLIGYIMLDPTQPGAAELLRASVEQQGLKGVTLFPAMHHFHVHDERVYPLYRTAAELGVPVFTHFGVLKVTIRDKLDLPNVFDLRYSNPLDLHQVAIDFPSVPFIIPHFGCGYLGETLMLGAQAPNVYVDTSSSNSWLAYLPSQLDLKTVFEKALQVFGPRRILFGTDSNVFPRGWRQDIFRQQVEILQSLRLSQADAGLLLGGNIARVLGLP